MTFDTGMMQVMGPSTKSTSTGSSSSIADQTTADALRGFFQDMTKTIQSFSKRHNVVDQSYADVRSSISLGIPPTAAVLPARQPYGREIDGSQSVSQNYSPVISGVQVNPKHYFEEGKTFQAHGWIPQGWARGPKTQGRHDNVNEEENGRNLAAGWVEREEQPQGITPHQMDPKSMDSLWGFLDDMPTTIESWSTRNNLLAQGNNVSVNSGPTPAPFGEPSSSYTAPRTADGVSCLGPSSEELDDDQVLHHPQQVDTDVIQSPQSFLGEGNAGPVTPRVHWLQPNDAEECPEQVSQHERCEPQLNEENEVAELSHLDGRDMEVVVKSPQATDAEVSISKVMPQLDQGKMDFEFTTSNDGREGDSALVQISGNGEVNSVADIATEGNANESIVRPEAMKSSQRVVTLVESPDWLPKGWMTEIKIRGNGHSAGAKDKYYYDPDSKRRFRSKKEVFCFLKTGKLGRYKPRPKFKSEEAKISEDSQIVAQTTTSVRRSKSRKNRRASLTLSTDLKPAQNLPIVSNSLAFSSVSPSGISSNVFMPHRPGQPSEWVVHESLTNLPFPTFEHFPEPDHNLTKLNGYKTSPNGQWVFNSDKSQRTSPDKNEVCKTARKEKSKGKDVTNLFCAEGEGRYASEAVQRHSAAGTKKFCKKQSG